MVRSLKIIFRNSLFGQYALNLVELMPKKVAIALSLMVLISINEAVGLVILIPLLQLVGLDVAQGSLGQLTEYISIFFTSLGLEPTLPLVLAIYVAVVSFSAILLRWQTMTGHEIQFSFGAYLRKRLYTAITNSNWLFFSHSKSSDFAHALTNEIERISNGTFRFLTLVASILILLVYIIFALKLAGIITGIIFLVGVAILLMLRKKVRSSRARGEEITTSTRDIYSSIIQHMEGMKTIKSFGMEEKNIKLFSDQTDHVAMRYIDTIRSYADVKLLFDIGTVVVLAIMVLVLIQVIKIPTATLLILIYIFVRMIPKFSTIQNSYQYFINMLPAFSNVIDLEKQCLEHAETPGSRDETINFLKQIKFQNVTFSYRGKDHFTLKDLNLRIPAGETTAIVGSSGAGKSTVADLLMGLIKPEEGNLTVDGIPITEKLIYSWRMKIGYIAQETFLFNESIRFNLLLADSEADENDLVHALKMAAAYDFVFRLPKGLDTVIGDRGVRLSGGERQRLALARALLRKPSLLIMDEATSNLDSDNEKKILKAIDDLHGDITILMIAHRISTIKNADYIYLMDNGTILESGDWAELLKEEKGLFRDLCQFQGINL